jgi:hypothetical protein
LDKPAGSASGGTGTGETDIIPLANTSENDNEPLAFTLNTASFSDKFSIIEDETKELNDKNYKWDFITNDNNLSDGIQNININMNSDDTTTSKSDKSLQSMEELKKFRDAQKF